jgi:hypothetical protein
MFQLQDNKLDMINHILYQDYIWFNYNQKSVDFYHMTLDHLIHSQSIFYQVYSTLKNPLYQLIKLL